MRVFLILTFLAFPVMAKAPLTLSSPPPTDARTALLKVMKTPTILILQEFKTVCEKSRSKIDFEGDQMVFDELTDLKRRGDLIKLRALLYSAVNCTDRKSQSSLMEFLGVEMLENYPVLLIRTLNQEKLVDVLALSLANAEPNEVSGTDCATANCKELKEKTFAQKRVAIETAKLRKAEEPIRQKLLAVLKTK